jgi:hypothetical protein
MIFIWYLKIIITFAPNGAVRFRAPLAPLKRRGFVFSNTYGDQYFKRRLNGFYLVFKNYYYLCAERSREVSYTLSPAQKAGFRISKTYGD